MLGDIRHDPTLRLSRQYRWQIDGQRDIFVDGSLSHRPEGPCRTFSSRIVSDCSRRMTATLDNAAADLQRANAELQRQLDEYRAELAARNSQYGERIEHQAASNEVLKAMSASPGDPQPVFDLIVDGRANCARQRRDSVRIRRQLIHRLSATDACDD